MRKKAFSIIELLIVISIIGILSAIGVASYNDYQKKAQNAKRVANCKQVETCELAKTTCVESGKTESECENICDVSSFQIPKSEPKIVNNESISFSAHISLGAPSSIIGFTQASGPGNTTPAAINSQTPTYFANPVILAQGTQLGETDNTSYYYAIIRNLIRESRAIGVNFPDANDWSYRVPEWNGGPGGYQIYFYVKTENFPMATAFVSNYVGAISDTVDSNLYVRGISNIANRSYVQYDSGC